MNNIRIAVVSDIHAFNSESKYATKDVSHFDISKPDNEPTVHPITGLLKLLKDDLEVRADILISAGDICDKACPTSLKQAWDKIQEIKDALGAQEVIATAGNHDLDSRYQHNDFDAKGMMLALSPFVPLSSRVKSDQFWARNFVVFNFDNVRFLIVNTSAYHGTAKEDEIHHGRISKQTLESIANELKQDVTKYSFSILLCHHHPLRHDEVDNDPSVMDGGDKLVDLVGSGLFGDWLVIHGHKHYPQVYYASGGGCAPVIFSAASLCANLYLTHQTRTRNQFHIVDIPLAKLDDMGLGVAGSIYSWNWAKGVGWQRSTFGSGLPYLSFFGYRGNPIAVSRSIICMITAADQPFMRWIEVIDSKPEYRYLTPSDLLAVIEQLRKNDYEITWSSNGSTIEEIGKKS